MSENIDINVGIIKEEISINAANNIVEVNISTAPVTIINPQNYDLSQFTNTSPNPFIQQSTLSSYVPISRIITINGVAQDLSTNRSWTIPGATWGSITGTLTAQTDLQAALNARVPYTGATSNVNLGEYGLTTGQLTLDTSPTGTAVVGTTRWNDSIGSSETTLKGGSVILKNGVDLVARVVNKVTPNTTLTKANYTAVRISGAQGQRLAVAYAQANSDANSADTIGLVAETIPTNQEGFIITVGNLEGVNTTGSLQGESWSDGDVLYLSPTIPGAITNIKPTGLTGHIVVIGYVEYAHAINGKIYVKIMNGWELDELHNVYINPATLANNNILQYDSADQLWKNKVLSTGITIGTTAIASGTVGRILFEGVGNVVQESSSLFWDATNNRLGVGTSSPSNPLHLLSATNAAFFAKVQNTNGGSSASAGYEIQSNTAYGSIFATPSAYAPFGVLNASQIGFYSTNTFAIAIDSSTSDFRIGTGLGATERMRIFSTGNVAINTTTDAGFRLDVNGTARVQGELTVNGVNIGLGGGAIITNTRIGINALIANTTGVGNVAIGINSLQANTTGNSNISIGQTTLEANIGGTQNTAVGSSTLQRISGGYGNTSCGFYNLNGLTSGSQNVTMGAFSGRFLSDGTTVLTTMNNSVLLGYQTYPLGNAQTNQIVIGHNAIGAGSNTVTLGNTSIVKTILRGTLNAANLPTSSAGLSAGDIWNDAGTLKIV